MAMVEELGAGFADKVMSAQTTFRTVMNAMACPGTVHRIDAVLDAPAPMLAGTAAIALTLFDHDTTLWLDAPFTASTAVAKWLKFHTGAPLVTSPSYCSFALIAQPKRLPDFEQFCLGSDAYPDRSTTLILQIEQLSVGQTFELSGPGIDGGATLRAAGLPDDLVDRLALNRELFPRGVDLVLVAGNQVAALPRTTRVVRREA
ncbi:carbon-phosphorus lyase [Afipia sp. P52-10]|jgi:alpha-D-ribose 1-methylphosphonate 5-triphosphate synthase subunit PhnH|uniref:phosphonate C-P lyase system protein PhnH n=1 Tax=Afipia sp. P52-10 TaxID=1429916 RepID=UPI0003DF12F6|nr:phosphonate C-P lyase system protein PhnH [Afipia sp. P52-10]ETR76680.1 carbon-phosphorus lyase [Afipia sp. P52-10]